MSKRLSSEDQIRQQLDAQLGRHPVNEFEWEGLLTYEYVADVELGGLSIEELADVVREARQQDQAARQLSSAAEQPKAEHHSPIGLREEALTALLAEEVAAETNVLAFRSKVLGGQLLDEADVLLWLKQRELEQVSADLWLANVVLPPGLGEQVLAALEERYDELPVDAQGDPLPLKFTITLDPHRIRQHLAVRTLTCIARHPKTQRSGIYTFGTRAGGVLEWLRHLGEQFAGICAWSEAEVVHFLLTGIPPSLPRIRESVHVSGMTVRIELRVDPAATPSDVAEFYRDVRRPIVHRTRSLDEKHLRLALFTVRQPRADGETWGDYMHRWNQAWRSTHGDWVYTQDTNFARDCTQARAHLRRPPYKVPVTRALARFLAANT